MQDIATPEDLLLFMAKVVEGKAKWADVNVLPSSLSIPVRTCGINWNGQIDARSARFILDLQENLEYNLKHYAHTSTTLSSPLINIQVEKGSTELLAELYPYFTYLVDKVNPEDLSIIIKYAVYAGVGFVGAKLSSSHFLTNQANKRKHELDKLKLENTNANELAQKELELARLTAEAEDKKRLAELLEKAVDVIASKNPDHIERENRASRPIRSYVKSLDENDRVAIAGGLPTPIKKLLPFFKTKRIQRDPRIRYVAVDATYNCVAINLDSKIPELEFEYSGKKYHAQLGRLALAEKNALLKKLDARIESQTLPFLLDLQVNAYFREHRLEYLTIVGLGAIRTDMPQSILTDIPHNVTEYKDEFS